MKNRDKTTKYVGVLKRKDMYVADPQLLVIVDTPAHVLCHPFLNRKKLDELLVRSIMRVGVLHPVKVCRGMQQHGVWVLEVILGRQRIKAAREANRRLRACGKPTLTVDIIIVDATVDEMVQMIREDASDTDELGLGMETSRSILEKRAMLKNMGLPESLFDSHSRSAPAVKQSSKERRKLAKAAAYRA